MGKPKKIGKSLEDLKKLLGKDATKAAESAAEEVQLSPVHIEVPAEVIAEPAYTTAGKDVRILTGTGIYRMHQSNADRMNNFTMSPAYQNRLDKAFADPLMRQYLTNARLRAVDTNYISFNRPGYPSRMTVLEPILRSEVPSEVQNQISYDLTRATNPIFYGFGQELPDPTKDIPEWQKIAISYNKGLIDKAERAKGSRRKFKSQDYMVIRDAAMTPGNEYVEGSLSAEQKPFSKKGWDFLRNSLLGGAGALTAAQLADMYFEDPTLNVIY